MAQAIHAIDEFMLQDTDGYKIEVLQRGSRHK